METTRNWIRDSVSKVSPLTVTAETLTSVEEVLKIEERAEQVEIAALEACADETASSESEDVEIPGEPTSAIPAQVTVDDVTHISIMLGDLEDVSAPSQKAIEDTSSDLRVTQNLTKFHPSDCEFQNPATESEKSSNTSKLIVEPAKLPEDIFIPAWTIPTISPADAHAALARYPSWQVAFFEIPHTPVMLKLSAPIIHDACHGYIALHDIICNLYPSASLAWHNHVLRIGTDRLLLELQNAFNENSSMTNAMSAMQVRISAADIRIDDLGRLHRELARRYQAEISKSKSLRNQVIDLEVFKAKHKDNEAPRLIELNKLNNSLAERNKTIVELKVQLSQQRNEGKYMAKRNLELEQKIQTFEAEHQKTNRAFTLNIAALTKLSSDQQLAIQEEKDGRMEKAAVAEKCEKTIRELKREVDELREFKASANTQLKEKRLTIGKLEKHQCPRPKKERNEEKTAETLTETYESTIRQQKKEIEELKSFKASADSKLVDQKTKADKWDKHQCTTTENTQAVSATVTEDNTTSHNAADADDQVSTEDADTDDFWTTKLRELYQILRGSSSILLVVFIGFLFVQLDTYRSKKD